VNVTAPRAYSLLLLQMQFGREADEHLSVYRPYSFYGVRTPGSVTPRRLRFVKIPSQRGPVGDREAWCVSGLPSCTSFVPVPANTPQISADQSGLRNRPKFWLHKSLSSGKIWGVPA